MEGLRDFSVHGSRATNATGCGVSYLRCSVKDVFAGVSATGLVKRSSRVA